MISIRLRNKLQVHSIVGIALLAGSLLRPTSAAAHQEGAPFSGAIIEPLKVHHAHIEDEQRLNFATVRRFRNEEGAEWTGFSNSLELAGAWGGDFRLGSEVFIPFSNLGSERGRYGIGDIEFWPLKWAFINKPEQIWTGVLAFTLPTGSELKGLGEGSTKIGPHFFLDHTWRNWFFGYNAEYAASISGHAESELETSGVVSYSFIKETGNGIAPSRPRQAVVPALSLELLSGSVLSGKEKGENEVSVLPGFHLWHPSSGWGLRVGIDVPVSRDKRNDYAVQFQVGNHFAWSKLFGRASAK